MISTTRFLAFSLTKLAIFFSIFFIQAFQAIRNSPLGFDNKLLENVFGHELVFNFYQKC